MARYAPNENIRAWLGSGTSHHCGSRSIPKPMNVTHRGSRLPYTIVAAAFLALLRPALVAPCSAAEGQATPAAHTGPQLTVSETMHEFGREPQGETLRHDFTLTNTGDAVLHITDVKPSCGCTTTGEWPHTLAPGASGTLPIKIDTAHFSGPIVKTLSIVSDDPAHPELTVEMRAKIWTPVSIMNPVLIFPAVTDPAQAATRSTTIRSEVDVPLKLSDLRSENLHFRPDLKEVIPGKEYELIVTTLPPLPDGTQSGRISMTTSNPQMAEISVQAVVTVLPPIQIAPTQISFGTPKLTQVEKRYAVVLNNRGRDVKVTDLATDAPGVTLASSADATGRQFTITLTFPIGFEFKPGDHYVLRGKTNQENLPTFEIPIIYNGAR